MMDYAQQPPAIIEQVKPPMATPQQQWSTLMDQLIREEANASKYRADVMNFTGAAANAKTEADAALVRVAALNDMLKLLLDSFKRQGLKFIDDEWVVSK